MNKFKYLVLITLIIAVGHSPIMALPGVSSKTATVEILYLNHWPVKKVLNDVDKILLDYGKRLNIIRYDYDTPEGKKFVRKRKLHGHVPLAIFINDSMEFKIKNQKVKFYSFPQGKGTPLAADGGWTMEDLKQVLEQVLAEK